MITSAVQKHSSYPVQIPNNITASLKNKHGTINGKQWEVLMVSAEYTVGVKKKKKKKSSPPLVERRRHPYQTCCDLGEASEQGPGM